ncbi:DNA repair protein RecO [Candidatus Saccharibacteria bacterium]|jgi:DNA repair protein RecO|nr:MAG: DNA repair protein RecO [Candidatus Saccharibacteria bacterium]
MQREQTESIVLSRRDYGEADRIVAFLSPKFGKISCLVKGARKPKSKMAGGIELFCVSDIVFINGRSELKTLVGASSKRVYDNISKNLEKTMWLYEVLKLYNKHIESSADGDLYELLKNTISFLNEQTSKLWAAKLYFYSRWLNLNGRNVDAYKEATGKVLELNKTYNYDLLAQAFVLSSAGDFTAKDIKIIRLAQEYDVQRLNRLSISIDEGFKATNLFERLVSLSL